MGVDVAVVIVTYNSASVVGGLLDSLAEALNGMTADVVVVDNGSTDQTVFKVTDRYEWVRVIRSSNNGYSAGINKGVQAAAESDSILILNPDTVLGKGSVPAMKRALAQPSVGIVAPRIVDEDGALSYSLRYEPQLLRVLGLGFTRIPRFSERITSPVAYKKSTEVAWATGAVLLIGSECFRALGGWDESFFLYSEETDFCLRARDKGWVTVLEPSAVAVHMAGGSGRSGRTQAMQALNQVRLYSRRHGRPKSWIFFLLRLIAELSRVVRSRPHSRSTLRALVNPRVRPAELGLSDSLLPSDRTALAQHEGHPKVLDS